MNKPSEGKVPCEVYSRIVGYLRPIQNWNDGKQAEWKERVPYEQQDMEASSPRKEKPID